MKLMYYISVLAILILAVWFIPYNEEVVDDADNLVGGDVDVHGCLGSAGYTYNDMVGACIRDWELNYSQRYAASKIVEMLDLDNVTIISVMPSNYIDTVYQVVIHHDSELMTYYFDKEPNKKDKEKTVFGCDIGYGFCPATGICINESIEICCDASNITVDMCESIFDAVRPACTGDEIAVAFVGDNFCCADRDENVNIASSEVCRSACEIIGFVNGTCAEGCVRCAVLAPCADGGLCVCS